MQNTTQTEIRPLSLTAIKLYELIKIESHSAVCIKRLMTMGFTYDAIHYAYTELMQHGLIREKNPEKEDVPMYGYWELIKK
jgi:hypothetical protein